MKKITILFLTTLCLPNLLKAQNFDFIFGMTYGNYNMAEVKKFQEGVKNSLPVNSKTMSSFPAYVGYEGKLSYTISRFKIGVFGSFNSTGSRLSYSDYSGSIEYNQLAKFKQIGIWSEFRLTSARDKKWEPFVSMQIGFGRTNFTINDHILLNGNTIGTEYLAFNSNHFTANPMLGLRRNFFRIFFASATVGFLIDSADDLHYSKDKDVYLLNDKYDPISVDWSGLRTSISVGIKFGNTTVQPLNKG